MSTEKSPLPLSVVIITLNEELNIRRAIDSVRWAHEIIVYDSGSTDRTVSVAQNMGAKVVQGAWLGFGLTKQRAVAEASHDWILSIDADEEVTSELALEITARFAILQPETAYEIPRLSNYLGQWIQYGGWFPDCQVRLFNRQHCNWDAAEIHEKVKFKSKESLLYPLNHYVFNSIAHQVQTNNRYSSLQALEMKRQLKNFSWFHYLTKPSVKFIECYFWKRGILDGWVGYLIARNAAYSVFLKWSKLKELWDKDMKS